MTSPVAESVVLRAARRAGALVISSSGVEGAALRGETRFLVVVVVVVSDDMVVEGVSMPLRRLRGGGENVSSMSLRAEERGEDAPDAPPISWLVFESSKLASIASPLLVAAKPCNDLTEFRVWRRCVAERASKTREVSWEIREVRMMSK